MKILAIETSCDETAAAIVENGHKILSNTVISQIDIHKTYGGVVPEIAARSHIEAIQPVIAKTLQTANMDMQQVDAIAVTHTPGLLGSLLIGTLTARTLSILHNKPLYPIHHLRAHIYANWLDQKDKPKTKQPDPDPSLTRASNNKAKNSPQHPDPESADPPSPTFPILALVISGGHTQLIKMQNHNNFQIIGTTRDDAIGEVFDKVAKLLGLPYPGGPSIAQAAQQGNPTHYKLPHPKIPGLDFSFSGLKTAVLRAIQKDLNLPHTTPSTQLPALLTQTQIHNFAASFQKTAIDILIEKLQAATTEHNPKSILLAGGVSANQELRKSLTQAFSSPLLFFPAPQFSTDNAAMVASAAYYAIIQGQKPTNPYNLETNPKTPIT